MVGVKIRWDLYSPSKFPIEKRARVWRNPNLQNLQQSQRKKLQNNILLKNVDSCQTEFG